MVNNLLLGEVVVDAMPGGQLAGGSASLWVLQIMSGVLFVVLLFMCFFLVRRIRKKRSQISEETCREMDDRLGAIFGKKSADIPENAVGKQSDQQSQVRNTVDVASPVEGKELGSKEESVDMDEVMQGLSDGDLRELVRGRLEQISRRTEDWALEVVDSLGEMEALKTYTAEDAQRLHIICAEMRRRLAELGCDVIDLDEWDLERQRVIKMERILPHHSIPQITKKVSPGLCVQGRLVRKQEVCINR